MQNAIKDFSPSLMALHQSDPYRLASFYFQHIFLLPTNSIMKRIYITATKRIFTLVSDIVAPLL